MEINAQELSPLCYTLLSIACLALLSIAHKAYQVKKNENK